MVRKCYLQFTVSIQLAQGSFELFPAPHQKKAARSE